ncbi:uncharacterized protein LOC62_05G007247 [Vanrija pseudolonga]|uniref:Small ribosomal subunit protein mS41 n=1 Tax=Vanrija pseudolonga TaxID=143232 RepID=A0AAF1BJQ1_9TREE|nr:hypothetical protein LOC62_05G007247 [Vanrija pseudolonga]
MFAALRASTSSLTTARSLSTSARVLAKQPLRAHRETPLPADLLAKIGRNADKKLADKAETWEALTELYVKGGPALEEAGLGIKDRRYALWAFSRYSEGLAPSTFINKPKPPKKFRGWGPKIQHGVRVKF